MSAHFDSWDGGSGATDDGAGSLSQLEAIRILKQVYPRPKRTILLGLWAAEEHGLIGSRAFTEDHPEVLKGLQAAFNEDGGTGRIQRISAAGLPNAAEHIQSWLSKLPAAYGSQINFGGVGTPSGGGSDNSSFSCHGLPAFGLGGQNWSYGNYTWHTQRDTYDKIIFDDLKFNASLTAMLVYLASEDPTLITRERVDLMALAQQRAAQAPPTAAGPGGQNAPMTWPTCNMAPRMTNPRL
jgi:Zn-dependent M28 family amino/carboxypeptidase